MENKINKLLLRQIKRHFGSVENLPDEFKGIMSDINRTYENFDEDFSLLQNSIEVSSQELRQAYQKQKLDAEIQKETINKIKVAINTINPTSESGLLQNETVTSESNYLFDSLIKLIEEHKHAEQEILKLSIAIEQNPASIVITDINGNIEYVNPKFCHITGYTKEEAIGKNPRILKTQTTSPELFKNLWMTILSGNEWRGEFHNKKKNGDLYWELASISAVKNSKGEIVNFLAIKEDITDQKKVIEALQDSEIKYREVVENVKEVIFRTNADGLWMFLNNAWEEITGFSVEESLGQLFANYVHPDDRQRNMELFEPLILRKKEYCRHQVRYLTKDGNFRWIEVFARLGTNEKDEITGTYGTLQDITERKLAEEALQSKTSLLEAQTDSTIDAILVIDNEQKRVLINKKAIELFEIPKHILEDEDDSILLNHVVGLTKYPEKFLEKVMYLYDHTKEISQDEIELKNGMVLDRYSAPVLGKDGMNYGRIWTFRDITKSKQAEKDIRRHAGLISSLLDSIPDIIFFKDVNNIYIGGNPAFAEFCGRSREEVPGMTDYDVFSREIADSLIEQDKQLMKFRKPVQNDLWITYPNGRRILVDTLKTPYLGPDGELIGVLGISRDITERKLAEATLQNERTLFRTIIDLIPDAVYVKDTQGRKIIANPKEVQLTGKDSEDEIIGMTDYDLLPIDQAERSDVEDLSVLQTGKPLLNIEGTMTSKDGRFHSLLVSKVPLYDVQGKITGLVGVTHDISERKQAEGELEESREKYRGLSEASFEAIFISEKGLCIEQNQAAEKMFGFSSEEALFRKGTDWIVPDDREMVLKNAILGHEDPYEATALRKNGTTFPCVLRGRMMHYKGRDVRVTSLSDISSLKKAELELIKAKEEAEESERKFMSIIQSQAEGIGFVNKNEVFEFANTASERIFETEDNELVGTCLYDFLNSDEKEKIDQQTRNRGDGYVNSYELQIITKRGNAKYIQVTATPKLDSTGNYLGAYGVFQDITDRKKAEDEVIRVSTRLALATLAGGVGVWDLDIVHNKLLWDDQMFALYGVKKEDFDCKFETWKSIIHHDDLKRVEAEIQMAIFGEKEFNTEYQVCWLDGSIHNIRALATIQVDDLGKPQHMIGTNWDITEQKKTEKVLLKARQEAETANKSKSVFLANMSHEIRTPLNAIIGFSQLMNRDKHLTDSQKEYINSIIHAGEHLLSLINDILELSKMEAGRLELNQINIDLYSLFGEIQMFFKEQVQAKHLQFIFETANDLPQFILVDDNKLRRIFINLIGNAIKFTDEGGIAVRIRTDKINERKDKLIVEIQDSGPGISEDELDKLFQHFVQTSTGINKSSGTGLGLALSRELAILMGGNISVTSELGKGSVFSFDVEIEVGKAETVKDTIKKQVIGMDKGLEDYRILVVDDKEENLQVVVKLLRMIGFETKEAVNGEDAIAKFEEWNPHLILMDMRMPVMDGYEATRLIKSTEKGKQTPIVALTASSFEDEKRKTIALGIQGYIRKPFRENELFGTIGNVLGINYIYEDEPLVPPEKHEIDDAEIVKEIIKLPLSLLSQLKDAVSVADLDRLIELIKSIGSENIDLAQHLMVLANNYDYDFLQQIFSKKEIE